MLIFYQKNNLKFKYILNIKNSKSPKAIKNFTTEKLEFNLIDQKKIHISHQIVSANQRVKIFEMVDSEDKLS